MTKNIARMFFVVSAILFSSCVHAASNPSLTAFERGIDEGEAARDRLQTLRITTMRIDAAIHGRMADVTIEARIENSGDELDEARFALALPPEAVVTGYALDVGGKLIEAELLDQPKARNVYENEVRGGIDPGLAEVTEQNLFQARIFPLTAEQPRNIRLRFSTPVDAVRGLTLPFDTEHAVDRLTLHISAQGFRTPPEVHLGKRTIRLDRSGRAWSGEIAIEKTQILGAFTVIGGQTQAPMLISQHKRGYFFQVADGVVSKKPLPAEQGGRLRVYWDRSLSRRDDLLDKEMDLLAAYADARKPEAIDIVTFADEQANAAAVTGSDAIRAALSGATYRGATSYARLDNLRLPDADRCLLFSDGIATLDQDSEFRPDCRLVVVVSEPTAGAVRLERIAQASRGQVLRLTETNGPDVLARLLKPAVAVVGARDDSGRRLDFRSLPTADGSWLVVGEMPESGDVHLLVSGLRKGLVEKVYGASSGDIAEAEGPAVLWAAQRVAQLADDPGKHDRMAALSKSYRVASPGMAFLVLERPDQYVNADINAPEGFSAEWMREYREAKAEHDKERSSARAERLKFVLEEWGEQKAWWNKRFTARPRPKRERASVHSLRHLRPR